MIGARLLLREVRTSDATGAYLKWMNDEEVLKFTESRFLSCSDEQLRQYIDTINKDSSYIFRAITLRESGRHIGNIKLGPMDWNHRFGDVGVIIGARECWGKGYAAESIRLLVEYAFASLRLHKLTAGCYATNRAAIKAFEKTGFAIEGVRTSQYLFAGHYVDLVLLGLINPAA